MLTHLQAAPQQLARPTRCLHLRALPLGSQLHPGLLAQGVVQSCMGCRPLGLRGCAPNARACYTPVIVRDYVVVPSCAGAHISYTRMWACAPDYVSGEPKSIFAMRYEALKPNIKNSQREILFQQKDGPKHLAQEKQPG